MKERIVSSKPEHEAFYQAINEVAKKHLGHLHAYEILAVASNWIGKLIALQDPRKVTREMALACLQANLETGNAQALAEVKSAGPHTDGKLSLIMARDSSQKLCLWACRGKGKGCERNRYRAAKAPCQDCIGPLPENMTIEEVQAKIARGDA